MSYSVTADGEAIDSPSLSQSGYALIDPIVESEINSIPTFTFSISQDHPAYEDLSVRKTIIAVYDDTVEIFRGRIMDITSNFYNTSEVYCEGAMGFLCDSIIPPFAYKGDVEHFLTALLDYHNQEVVTTDTYGAEEDTSRKIILGDVDADDIELEITTDSATTTWDTINSYLVDEHGGYLLLELTSGTYTLSYYEDLEPDEDTEKYVKFAVNLVDLEQYLDGGDIITCLIPFGAQISDDEDDSGIAEEDEDNNPYVDEDSLLLESDGETEITDTLVTWRGNRLSLHGIDNSSRNDGDQLKSESKAQGKLDDLAIKSIEGIELWGEIWGTETFDDITQTGGQNQTGLYSKGYWYLYDKIQASKEITLSAVDVSMIDPSISPVKVGDTVLVRSTPHALNSYMICSQVKTCLRSPEDSAITLGATGTTLTGTISKQ